MRKHLLGLMLIAGMAGCTSESDVPQTDSAADRVPAGAEAAPLAGSLAAARSSDAQFAALPDRGELLAYGGARKPRVEGAYTWHPVAISEAHALNAIGGGRLSLNTPDGKVMNLRYERHEEQPDGNWTWVGRDDEGGSAVLTFGERAVFGVVSRGDTYYRLRTDRTGAWIVDTDRRLVSAAGGWPREGEDVLMPPDSRALAAAAARHLESSAGKAVSAPGDGAPIIDVLLGYSSTIATELGSQSAAVTLVSNLVATANAAYANSGVNMRLRPVHAMAVNYPDGTQNRTALQQLTGYNVDTQQPVTPRAEFSALRAARNQYGADLVAFVRRYREPEQNGCGIAWLLGMNQSGISPDDDAFGYAVISDGVDLDEGDGNTYFCSNYSLAHEFGHLMGQAHDRSNAPNRGVHSYSYGYRETSPTGFFTIMAYPASDSQIEAPLFANPSVRFSGRATGNSSADNVRSMNQTMPIIANFRATVVPVPGKLARNDINGDGRSDLLWFKPVAGDSLRYWTMNGASRTSTLKGNLPSGTYRFVASGDFNADGKVDVLWRKSPGNALVMWIGNGTTFTERAVESYSSVWEIEGVADVDGDGRSDIVWKHATAATSNIRIWYMNSNVRRSQVAATTSAKHRLEAVGDFNGDGKADLLWRFGSDAAIWYSKGSSFDVSAVGAYSSAWRVIATGDMDGDGRDDMVWWNSSVSSTNLRYWAMTVSGRLTTSGTSPSGMDFAASGDFNADGRLDLVWRNGRTLRAWIRGTTGYSSQTLPEGYAPPWTLMD